MQSTHGSRVERAQSELVVMAQPPQSLRRKQYIQEDTRPSNLNNVSGKEFFGIMQKIIHQNG